MDNSQDSYNKGGFLAFLLSVGFCLVFFIYISFIHPGVDLNELNEQAAAKAEQQMADGGTKKVDISGIEKPWIENEDMATHGAAVYKTNCAVCHGASGRGDGPAGAALVPPPRDMIAGDWKVGGSSIALYKTLQDGIPGGSMASFKHLPKADRWALVQYIRSVTENKIKDDAAKLEEFAQTAD